MRKIDRELSSNVRICFENPIDFATVIDEALKSTSREFRATYTPSPTAPIIQGDFADLSTCNFFSLFNHNISSQGKWRFRLFKDPGQSGLILYDSNFLPCWNFAGDDSDFSSWQAGRFFSVAFIPEGEGARSFEVYVDDPASAEVSISRLWTGYYYTPTINMSYGLTLNQADNASQIRMESGSLLSEGTSRFRKVNFQLELNTLEEKEKLSNFLHIIGKRRDFFLSCFPETFNLIERNYTMMGKLVTDPTWIKDYFQNWSTNFDIEEI
jgi:hypothetical protein